MYPPPSIYRCDEIVASLAEISNTTDCNDLTDEQLGLLRQSFGARDMEHQGVGICLLLQQILLSDHPVPKLAEICFLAQVPITDTYFKAQLELTARVTYDDEHHIQKYDDGGDVVFGVTSGTDDYEESLRVFLLKTVDKSRTPKTLAQLFDAFNSSTSFTISYDTFEKILANLAEKILETSELETRAKFCFVMSIPVDSILLESIRKVTKVQLNDQNQIESLQFFHGGDRFSREPEDLEVSSKSSTPRLVAPDVVEEESEVRRDSESSDAFIDVESFSPGPSAATLDDHLFMEQGGLVYMEHEESYAPEGFYFGGEDSGDHGEVPEAPEAPEVCHDDHVLGIPTTSEPTSHPKKKQCLNSRQGILQEFRDYKESVRVFLLETADRSRIPITSSRLFAAYNASSLHVKPIHTFRRVFKSLTEKILETSGLETKIKFCFVMGIQVNWNLLKTFRRFARIRVNDANQIESLRFKYGGDSFSGRPLKPRGKGRIQMEKDSDYEEYVESESESDGEPEDVPEASEDHDEPPAESGSGQNPINLEAETSESTDAVENVSQSEDVVTDGTFNFILKVEPPEVAMRLEDCTTPETDLDTSSCLAVNSEDPVVVSDAVPASEVDPNILEDVPTSEVASEDVTTSEVAPEDATAAREAPEAVTAARDAPAGSKAIDESSEGLDAEQPIKIEPRDTEEAAPEASKDLKRNHPAPKRSMVKVEDTEPVEHRPSSPKRVRTTEPVKQEPSSPTAPASSAHQRVIVKQEVLEHHLKQQRALDRQEGLAATTVVAPPTLVLDTRHEATVPVPQVRVKKESRSPEAEPSEPQNPIPFNLDLVREEVEEEEEEEFAAIETTVAHSVLNEMSQVLHELLGNADQERFEGTLRAWRELLVKIRTLGGRDIDDDAVGQAFKAMIEKKLVPVPISHKTGICVVTFLDQLLRETKIRAVYADGEEETALWKVLKRAIKEKRKMVYSGEVFPYDAIDRCFLGIVSTLEILL